LPGHIMIVTKVRLVWQAMRRLLTRLLFTIPGSTIHRRRRLVGWSVAALVFLVVGHWAWAAHVDQRLIKTPHYQRTRDSGACPAPTYTTIQMELLTMRTQQQQQTGATVEGQEQQQQERQPKLLLDPHDICLTTLTDEAAGGWYQKLLRRRNFHHLLDLTWPNKMAYTGQHGYRLFNESTNSLDTSRPPSWSKMRAVKRLMLEEGCQWVFWMVRNVL
jgi:hypothetical protein